MKSEYLETALLAIEKASQELNKYYNSFVKIPENIDIEIEKIIREEILSKFPEHSFDGEELGLRKGNEFLWYCDPISSTNNFRRKLPHFAVCLSLFSKNNPVLGVVSDPSTNEVFYAEIGKGAYINGNKIKPSNKKNLIKSSFISSPKINKELFEELLKKGSSTRILGSWSIHFVYVASGKIDLCFSNLKDIYGTSAGLIIAKEAGCFIKTDNKAWNLKSKKVLVSSTKNIFNSIETKIFE